MLRFPSLQSGFNRSLVIACAGALAFAGCGDDDPAQPDSSATGGMSTGGASDGGAGAAGAAGGSGGAEAAGGSTPTSGGGGAGGGGAPTSCLDEGHVAGERYSVGDDCNFCDCNADGSSTCTDRDCDGSSGGCEYNGVAHLYAEVFPASDNCNECVCAASGLACTRRECTKGEGEGAILVESLDTPCGDDPTFTAQAVLDGLPIDDFVAPFEYDTTGPLYPESLPDTNVRIRVVYDDGFAVCRIPNPGQEAFDIEVVVEWITEDGSFDEGFHTYLRRNAGGFTDAWYLAMGAPAGGLDGTFNPACLDPNGFSFGVTFDATGVVDGSVGKTCETDILLTVGSFLYP
jgi:hypothetical protein